MKKTLLGLLAALAIAAAPLAHSPDARAADPKAAPAQTGAKLDLNSASAEELATLKGIGPVRAEAIVKGRPYKGKDDLVRRKIVPQSVYDQIREDVVARQK
ncbi:ComEA family DNA-binding protein [Quisquiliibacterium transsilvanicum]|jgi:DNA uptake protein ComE-like DNA-binding protein|uniref:DNA uptake protein ComE-like DNA-binding protein n=1 Tax=Quisquiliibacterium transsilvanicum TaxID=1549638 RepID=A0A7W8HJG8_9BURK|nr:helix-hairpin-helix domain-containing protein [Quisquiliibacterium transsilvanicum]MBB5273196.1 DNA uptake protein ComE-like DNA-binding protein [Quisquiliibacterium transsilvanicum]